jgi:hypothetical protein
MEIVVAINWIETAVFIVVYCPHPENGENVFEFNVCLISKEVPAEAKYLSFGDICFPMMSPDASLTYYMTPSIKSWGSNIRDLISIASSPSLDVGVIGRAADGSWQKWDLDDTHRPALPGTDSLCVGVGLDLTSEDPLPPLDEDAPEIQPVPIIYVYNNFGELAGYHIVNMETAKAGKACPAMVRAQPLPQGSVKKVANPPTAAPISKPTSAALPSTPFTTTKPVLPGSIPLSSASAGISFKAPTAAAPLTTSTPLQNKSPTASKGMFGGPPTSFSTVSLGAPGPALNPGLSFQQTKPVMAKQQPPGTMQKLLQEPDEPIKILRKKGEEGESPSIPAPKVSAAMDALSRQLENAYLAMTEELKTLHNHVRETEELVKAREHVFVELDQFMAVTTKRIRYAKETKALAETVMADFVQLRADLIKGMFCTEGGDLAGVECLQLHLSDLVLTHPFDLDPVFPQRRQRGMR